MELSKYLEHVVRLKSKTGGTYVGFVQQYRNSRENYSGKQEITLDTPVIEFSEDDIEEIECYAPNSPNTITLITISEIAKQLNDSIENIHKELCKIKYTEYRIDDDLIMYDLNTALQLVKNYGRTDMFEWYCECCNDYLNDQGRFINNNGTWVCSRCGHINEISKENIKGFNQCV